MRKKSGARNRAAKIAQFVIIYTCLGTLTPGNAHAEEQATTLEALRIELEAVKSEYERRIKELEQRLQSVERDTAARDVSAAPASTSGRGSAVSDKAFNPAISFILDARYTDYSRGDGEGPIAGFQVGGEAEGAPAGFSLSESELNLQASVDDKFYGVGTLALEQEGGETEVALEEAYIQTLNAPSGLTFRAGKFFSDIGYLNSFHQHASDFSDEPLPYRVMLGTRLKDTGFQASWVAPTILYLKLGTELFAGDSFPAAGSDKNVGSWSAFAKFGGDIGASHSWLAGVSFLSTDPVDRATGEDLLRNPLFTGNSDLWVASFVWKWAPYGNTRDRNFKLQAELFSRDEDGTVFLDGATGRYTGDQRGFYVQGVYQFRPQWRAGLRFDRLDSDNRVSALPVLTQLHNDLFSPKRLSAMLEFSNSEFSTLRLQYSRDESLPRSNNLVILEYVMSIGAHGGHAF